MPVPFYLDCHGLQKLAPWLVNPKDYILVSFSSPLFGPGLPYYLDDLRFPITPFCWGRRMTSALYAKDDILIVPTPIGDWRIRNITMRQQSAELLLAKSLPLRVFPITWYRWYGELLSGRGS